MELSHISRGKSGLTGWQGSSEICEIEILNTQIHRILCCNQCYELCLPRKADLSIL